jgi:cell fate regulator YaaT (PSP1 superfamily)
VKLAHHAKTFYFDSTGFLLLGGDHCIVESDQGEAYGTVAQATGPSRKFAGVRGMKKVLRRARPEDEQVQERNAALGREALDDCRSRARALNLDMKLVSVDAAFDERKLTFFFTAEERVDFRELVRDLAQRFRRRIEMRQVGARDEAKILGGYGICGRPLCCSTFLTEFAPISVRMAKRQGLSLNPSKISGLCGRLMCCLRYEDYDVGGRPAAAKGDPVEAPPQPAPSSPPAASSSS